MHLLISLLTFICFGSSAMEVPKPHVVVYGDINKTIVPEDQAKGLNSTGCRNALLAEAPEYAHTWGENPIPITYKEYVTKTLAPGSETDAETKAKREELYRNFLNTAFGATHPKFQEMCKVYDDMFFALKAQEPRDVLTSFSNLVKYLRENHYPFSIVLRTFGHDLDWVSKELKQDGLHGFIQGKFVEGVLHLEGRQLSHPQEMIAAFQPDKHYAIQDSYDWWKRHGLTAAGGKPYPIDLNNRDQLTLFLDDNAADPDKPILNIMAVGGEVSLDQLIALNRVVPVDTRQAILDPQYYVRVFKGALRSHALGK